MDCLLLQINMSVMDHWSTRRSTEHFGTCRNSTKWNVTKGRKGGKVKRKENQNGKTLI